jgi:hypothetical protein
MEATLTRKEKMTKLDVLTLELFNSCLVPSGIEASDKVVFSLEGAFVLDPKVSALSYADEIKESLLSDKLSGENLNSTFHKSWSKILNSSREELLVEQVLHYTTTYGFKKLGIYSDNTIYIPNEVLNVPGLDVDKLPLKVIKSITEDELVEKCLNLFRKGIALERDTIDSLLFILEELDYTFTSDVMDTLKNKEANTIIMEKYNVFPNNPVEFLRFMIYKSTGDTLIIQNTEAYSAIRESGRDISGYVESFGYEKLARIFLRFKNLFLAFKKAHTSNRKVVNKLRKLAKKYHKAMPLDILNNVTNASYSFDELEKALENANPFRKIRLLESLAVRMTTDARMYRIRNGKVFLERNEDSNNYTQLYNTIYDSLVNSLSHLKGKRILMTESVDYALPSSEKMYIGNMPIGTSFNVGENALFGIYWENLWGATDLDLSAMALNVKIGWNSDYKNDGNSLMYSGDMTSAPNGASEFLYAKKGLDMPYLVMNNIYSGSIGCKAKIIIAKENADGYSRDYMVDPNNVIYENEITLNSKQETFGVFLPTEDGVRFILAPFNSGNKHISGHGEQNEIAREYLMSKYTNVVFLNEVLDKVGAIISYNPDEETDIDLTIQNLEKDSIMNLFEENN